jgi:hypothetical protein
MIIFVIMFIPSNFAVIFMLNRYGLRWTLTVGAVFIIGGAWVRLIITVTDGFGIVCIGSMLVAFGQVCFINCVSKVASVWFSDK